MAQETQYDPARFDKVDQHADPSVFVHFMDKTRRVPSIQQQKDMVQALLEIHPGDSVLDVGCGTGDDLLLMARRAGEHGWAVGVDSSERMVSEARKRCADIPLPIEVIIGSAYELPLPDGRFDAVRCERVFEHLSEPGRALREMLRVTRSGGRIVVAASDVDSHLFDLPDPSLIRKVVHADCDRRPNGWAGRRLYCQLKEAGLSDLRVTGVVHCTGDYEKLSQVQHIDQDGERAFRAGQITKAESIAWSRLLEDARRTGHFFWSTTHIIVAGRKP